MTSPSRRRAGAAGLALGLAAAALLVVQVAQGLDRPLGEIAPDGYRYWEDFGVAVRLFRGDVVASPRYARDFDAGEAEVRRLGIRPWQFWRTADSSVFPGSPDGAGVRPLEDLGRARLLAWFFRSRSGIAPMAGFWLAVVLAVPALVWTGWEMAAAGHAVAGAVFLLTVATSAFVADALPLAYSPIGFYLVGVLLLVPWAVALLLGAPSDRGVIARAAASGLLLAVCVGCRSGTSIVVPGFLAAAAVAARRPSRSRAALLAAAVLITVFPLATRLTVGGHDFWIGLWEGMGDFDQTKGHAWSDAMAKRVVVAHGLSDLRSPEAQPLFRDDVLTSIATDPAWYAAILGRRLAATLAQSKLWGPGMRPSTRPGEGVMDAYYALARPVDVFALGPRAIEIPVPVLLAGPVLLGLLVVWPRSRDQARPEAMVVLCLLAGTLGVPVLLSTAGAFETEAAALPWLLAGGFVVEHAVRHVRSRYRGASDAAAERRSASIKSTIRP